MHSNMIKEHFEAIAQTMVRLAESQADPIMRALEAVKKAIVDGHKVLLFGNGGSAADAQHLAAEFVGRFRHERPALPALALTVNTSVLTAIGNDYTFELIFARQVQALGRAGDVAIGISTSGRSPNVLAGISAAAELGLTTIGFTGGDGGVLADRADIAIIVPATDTARIQECHIAIGHLLCDASDSAII
jgi:D-sedoheptulose 7-phosphate isomerase